MPDPVKESTILHVDMDAFFASVEQRDHPQWKGLPVVVGSPPDKRGVVSAASYEARKFGIHSAMPSREAGKRCPHAIFTPPNIGRYAEVSAQIFAIFERYTPEIEGLSLDEAFLDVTKSLGLFGTGLSIAEAIRAAIHGELGLTASVGIASNKFLAKIASDMNKPDGVTLVPREPRAIKAFLAPLPIGRLWGVGKVTEAMLRKAGLHTIGAVQEATDAQLLALVTKAQAQHFRRLCAGEDDRRVEPHVEAKGISREQTFGEDVSDPRVIRETLLFLIEDVGRQLREAGKYARVVGIKVRWQGFETITRRLTLTPAACDNFTLRRSALALLDKVAFEKPVRLVGFGVYELADSAGEQMNLLDATGKGPEKHERLSRTLDEIGKRFGRASRRRAP
ncbi:MAG: DNA polymerase IV [Spirochaetes bacterium]|nr:DNA polymerase IV [Spirochaetota bacterium]